MSCINVSFLIVIFCHCFARCYHWRNLGPFHLISYGCIWTYNYVKIKKFNLKKLKKKRCSTLLIIREMQTKTTMRYYLTLVRMATINKSTNNKCWWGCGEKENLVDCWWKCRLVQPLWKNSMEFPPNIKNGTAFWASDPTSRNIY